MPGKRFWPSRVDAVWKAYQSRGRLDKLLLAIVMPRINAHLDHRDHLVNPVRKVWLVNQVNLVCPDCLAIILRFHCRLMEDVVGVHQERKDHLEALDQLDHLDPKANPEALACPVAMDHLDHPAYPAQRETSDAPATKDHPVNLVAQPKLVKKAILDPLAAQENPDHWDLLANEDYLETPAQPVQLAHQAHLAHQEAQARKVNSAHADHLAVPAKTPNIVLALVAARQPKRRARKPKNSEWTTIYPFRIEPQTWSQLLFHPSFHICHFGIMNLVWVKMRKIKI